MQGEEHKEMTSRELVYKTLEFQNFEWRAPRDLWVLPWAQNNYPRELSRIYEDFPNDFDRPEPCYKKQDISKGDPYEAGRHIDAWGCFFENLHPGVHGQVKEALVNDDEWDDISKIHIPVEWLSIDISQINAQCDGSDKFMISSVSPRPFEQLQFIRGTENLMCDLMFIPSGLKHFIQKMHTFYCDLLELWANTNVDALFIMDDWGSQTSLLINPILWEQVFKPMYKDYITIAHKAGKKIFMHSDGNTTSIYPHFIEMELDAINSQIFCIGLENLKQFAGKITFWGEIDRQHILTNANTDEVKSAVRTVRETFWANGGAIAQCEFGAGNKPENIRAVFEAWM